MNLFDKLCAMSDAQEFCLQKKDHHQLEMVSVLERMFKEESMTDVTLMSDDGNTIKAHRVILSANSEYFKNVFDKCNNPYQYPVVIMRDIPFRDLKVIIEFIYRGEVILQQEQLESLLRSAEWLKIKGLEEENVSEREHCNGNSNPGKKRRRKRRRRKSNNVSEDGEDEEQNEKHSSDEMTDCSEDFRSMGENEDDENENDENTSCKMGRDSTTTNEGDITPARIMEQSLITDSQELPDAHRFSSSSQMSNEGDQNPKSIGLSYEENPSSELIHSFVTPNSPHPLNNTNSQNAQLSTSNYGHELAGPSHSVSHHHPAHHRHSTHNDAMKRLYKANSGNQMKTQLAKNQRLIRQRFHCHICHQGFTAKRNLQRHMQIHSYLRNKFECDVCHRQFSWKHTLIIHKEKVHFMVDNRP